MVHARSAAWLTALGALGILLLIGSALPGAGDIEERGNMLLGPLTQRVSSATRPLADVLQNAGQLRELSQENAALRQTVEQLEGELSTVREGRVAVEQGAALIDAVGPEEADRYTSAAVILRDPTATREIVVLDRGQRHGISLGQPVLGPGATLVGIVIEVHSATSRVRLLNDTDSAVTALVQSSRTPGALVGGDGTLRLDFVPIDASVMPGDLVLTSALGGNLPGGLLIGRVVAVSVDPRALFQEIEVEPLADYARLERVLVLTDFLASDPGGGPAS